MKRLVLLSILMTFALGAKAYHWTPNSAPYSTTATIIGVVQIDGQEQTSTTLEVGVFCGDECRGREMPMYVSQLDRYILFLTFYGNDDDELHFLIYDHSLSQELDLSCTTTLSFLDDAMLGTLSNPYILNFETPPTSYTIALSSNPLEGGGLTGDGSYVEESTATVTASAAEGYAFVNWTEDDEVVSTDTTYSFTVTGDRSLVANFSLNSYEVAVTASPTEAGTVTGTGTYEHGSEATLSATANEGYTFVSWTENGEVVSTEATYTFLVTGERSLVGNFEVSTYYVVTLVDPIGGGMVTGAGSYEHGSTTTLTAQAAAGYEFVNWTEDGEELSAESSVSMTVTSDRNITAHFNYVGITLHWTPSSAAYAGTATMIGVIQINGEEQRLNSLEIGVFCGEECRGSALPLYVSQLDRYLLFLSIFGNDGDEITFRLYDHSLDEEPDMTCESTETFTTNAMFGTGTSPYVLNFVTVVPSYNVSATANPAEGGTVTGAGSYDHGTTATLTAAANEGYTFVNWTEDGEEVSTEASYSFTVTGTRTLVAIFSLNNYEIVATANPTEGGTVIGAGSYDHGTTATLTATANEGYTFVNWTEDGEAVSSEATYSFTVTEVRTLVANFETVSPSETTQTITLGSGWTWFSSYIEYSDASLGQLQTGIAANSTTAMIKGQTEFTSLGGGNWSGGLTSLNNETMYLISSNGGEITLTGVLADPTAHPITLTNGWSWIGFLSDTPMSIEEAMSSITPSVNDMVKSQNGFTTFDGSKWTGGLTTLVPGQGYLYLHNGEPIILTYPSPSK